MPVVRSEKAGKPPRKYRPHIRPNARGEKNHAYRFKKMIQERIQEKGLTPVRGKKKMGRPTILTPEVEREIVEAIERGNYLKDACDLAGVSDTAVQEWITKGTRDLAEGVDSPYASFAVSLKKARARVGDLCLRDIRDRVKQWQAAAWFLERTRPQQFGPTQRIEHTGVDGGPIEMKHQAAFMELSRLSPQERAQLELLLEKARGEADSSTEVISVSPIPGE